MTLSYVLPWGQWNYSLSFPICTWWPFPMFCHEVDEITASVSPFVHDDPFLSSAMRLMKLQPQFPHLYMMTLSLYMMTLSYVLPWGWWNYSLSFPSCTWWPFSRFCHEGDEITASVSLFGHDPFLGFAMRAMKLQPQFPHLYTITLF
jgi:hypothetical protein